MTKVFNSLDNQHNAILNISTMPRNMIFSVLHFLDKVGFSYDIKYYSPYKHGKDLTRNPSKPQLILQHGGIIYPEKKTILVIILGHDIKRVHQLNNFFEPFKIFIGLGSKHHTALPEDYDTTFEDINNKEIFKINSFSHEDVLNKLNSEVLPLLEEYNILLCSLGPKIEAIAIYKFHKMHPETALVYAPSKDYADDYSEGINLDNIKSISSSWIGINN
ncbi:MAG: hypothetical protein GQ570_05905 [Helicobacteraceae bacterium]|nr:hypothetical protein [Helicobacteraceae bacterium]